MPAVTVLTAVRNGAAHLSATIASIQAQTWPDWEYLIVDDASTDATPDIVADFAASDCRIRLVRRVQSSGPFVAANEGLHHARGRYIVRTDGDDVSMPTRIERQLAFLHAHPGRRACAAFCQTLRDDGPVPQHFNTAPLTSGSLKWYLSLRCPLVHSSACIQRDALLTLGGYRELPLAQDYRLWCDLARAGWLVVCPEVLVYFREHDRRLTTTRTREQRTLGKQVLHDHITALTGETWTQHEVDALAAVGVAELFPIRPALTALARWDACWAADGSLSAAERTELAALSAFRRRKFLRCNAKRQPGGFLRSVNHFLFPAPSEGVAG